MNENARDMFIQKLNEEIAWQWKWEKLNRFLNTTTMWITWFSSFLILVLSFLQLQIRIGFTAVGDSLNCCTVLSYY